MCLSKALLAFAAPALAAVGCGTHGGRALTCGAETVTRPPCAAAGPLVLRRPGAPLRRKHGRSPAGREVVASPPCAAAGWLRLARVLSPLQSATDGAETVNSFLAALASPELLLLPPTPPPPWVGPSAAALWAARNSASAGVSGLCLCGSAGTSIASSLCP